jgi:alkyl sulfatase BDS1-like metallo-beta-lactamase superfamily hydrolase
VYNILKKFIFLALILSVAFVFLNPDASSKMNLNSLKKEATEKTSKINQSYYTLLNFDDEQELEFATRGLLAAPESLELRDHTGKIIWSQKAYEFLDEHQGAPNTVNPSLWRNTVLNHSYGLFEVCKGIYQVRGYDMANLTLIETKSGGLGRFRYSFEC